jgi:NAD-dependent SIR2 family protein deacetylase
MPRVKVNRRGKKPVYLHSEVCKLGGSEIHCLGCGYTGKADRVVSNALRTGEIEKCPNCRSLNFENLVLCEKEYVQLRLLLVVVK